MLAFQDSVAIDDPADVLVKALEKFIVPIIQTQLGANYNVEGLSGSHHGEEAQALVSALKSFVTMLMRSTNPVQGNTMDESTLASALDDEPREQTPPVPAITTASMYRSPSPRDPLLQQAMDQMRSNIFNDFPFRMMSFNAGGSGIELVERNQIWWLISLRMERDFPTTFQFKTVKSKGEEEAIKRFNAPYSRFSILSHTWIQDTPGEVTFNDWNGGHFDKNSVGYQKLANFCRVAASEYGITLGWMDTICMDKESSSELDESIRSMFKWYSRAHICITYLKDTITLDNMRNDSWFTRGWTLQELLAPRYTKFYNAGWNTINPGLEHDLRDSAILDEVEAATGISRIELSTPLWKIPISNRMRWAANRKVTRVEDTSYSLMGIFGVSISMAYGEGPELAFVRLLKEIMATERNGILDILNFGHGDKHPSQPNHPKQISSALIPLSPKQYLYSKPCQWPRPTTPITFTHIGLRLSVLLMPSISVTDLPLHHKSCPVGGYSATITEDFIYPNNSVGPGTFMLLESFIFEKPTTGPIRSEAVVFWGVLNFYETSTSVQLSHDSICYARPLISVGQREFNLEDALADTSMFRVLYTPRPAFFSIKSAQDTLEISKAELERNGMYLRTMYL